MHSIHCVLYMCVSRTPNSTDLSIRRIQTYDLATQLEAFKATWMLKQEATLRMRAGVRVGE